MSAQQRRQDPTGISYTLLYRTENGQGVRDFSQFQDLPQKNLFALKMAAGTAILYLLTLPLHCAPSPEE